MTAAALYSLLFGLGKHAYYGKGISGRSGIFRLFHDLRNWIKPVWIDGAADILVCCSELRFLVVEYNGGKMAWRSR